MKLIVKFKILLLTICAFINNILALNILGVFPYQGNSHFFVFQPYLQEIARRGHNLTVISYFPQRNPIQNYHDISLAGSAELLEGTFPLERSYLTVIGIGFFLVNSGNENCKILLAHDAVQRLWKSHSKFDLVVTEQFNSDCVLGLAYKLGAPVVGLNSHFLLSWHYDRFGIQYNPSYMPFLLLEGGTKPSLYQRIERVVFHAYFNFLYKHVSQRIDQKTLAQYFDNIPPLEELGREIKFMLVYHHFVLGGSSLFPSNVIEVGGYHVAKPKELPSDIKKYIEESEHGVIYISFGSMIRATTMPKDKLEIIIEALSELPQRVIWKWEEMTLPGNPKNIYLSNWLPQNDILAHPKVLAFYSHCGQLSTTEAIYHAVPVVAMPVFGDQPTNAAAVEESGLGLQIQIRDLTKENLLEKFRTVLAPEFRRNVKLLSEAWHDRPISAMDSAIYWTEFAAKHRNYTFRARAADVPFYKYLYFDIFLIIGGILIAIVSVINLWLSQFCKNTIGLAKKKPKVN